MKVQSRLQEMIDSLKELYGLDLPLWQQYLRYLWNTFRFDLGFSIFCLSPTGDGYHRADDLVDDRALWARRRSWPLSWAPSSARWWGGPKPPSVFGYFIPPLAMFSAVPGFILALVLIYFFAFKMQQWTDGSFYFPLRGGYSNDTLVDPTNIDFWLDVAWHSVLPAISMLLVTTGGWALGMRAMMVTVEGADYITFAEAKGLKGSRIFLRYAVRNCMLPQTTALAMQLGAIVSGATLVEGMFSYPGIGSGLMPPSPRLTTM